MGERKESRRQEPLSGSVDLGFAKRSMGGSSRMLGHVQIFPFLLPNIRSSQLVPTVSVPNKVTRSLLHSAFGS